MQFRQFLLLLLSIPLPFTGGATGSIETDGTPSVPFHSTADKQSPGLTDSASFLPQKTVSGPISPTLSNPQGSLTSRIIYLNAGHGWAWTGSTWALGRPVLNEMNEDYGNLDQMTLAAYYFLNAGATVVPFRPIGNQTNEVVVSASATNRQVLTSPAWTKSSPAQSFASFAYFAQATSEQTEASEIRFVPDLPAAGVYPVYTWVSRGSNRVHQLYRVLHLRGESQVRVPHQMVGNGWVYLGSYYFGQGQSTNAGAVCVSNLIEPGQPAGVAIADTIRFGNGMGDVDRGGGVSTYPREEEASRYWVQRALAPWQSSTIYDSASLSDESDNVGAPIRMAAEMNRETEGNMFKRVYVSFHSNAGGGRGVLGLYNDPALSPNVARNSNTPNQLRLAQLLAQEVNNDMVSLSSSLETPWFSRGANVTYARTDFAFGEINNNTISNEFDATIVEVAFHDDPSDARLMRDPKARNWVARAVYQGVVRYMSQFDSVPLAFLPEPPGNVRATATSYVPDVPTEPQHTNTNTGTFTANISWSAPGNQGGAGLPSFYRVRLWNDSTPAEMRVVLSTNFSATVQWLRAGKVWFAQVSAVNDAGESMPSEVIACRSQTPPSAQASRVLFVNGFTRMDRALNLRQTPTPRAYNPPGHNRNTGTMERVLPAQINSFDYVIPHAQALERSSAMALDSCQVQAVTNGNVKLSDYDIVLWASGNQSTANRTFTPAAQAAIAQFRSQGGHLFVSGAEVAWDLDRPMGPTTQDRKFLNEQLHARYIADDSGLNTFGSGIPPLGGFAGAFDDGSSGIYSVRYPDVLMAVGEGAYPALFYKGTTNAAAVAYSGADGGGKVLFFGFPFETILDGEQRRALLRMALRWFSRPARITSVHFNPPNQIQLQLTLEPSFSYALESSANLAEWSTVRNMTADRDVSQIQLTSEGNQQFFRLRLLD